VSVGAEARWCQSPRFSASLIGLRVRVCGGAVGTVNVGSRAPAKPLFYMAHCHERQAPPIRARLRSGSRDGIRSGDNPERSYPYTIIIIRSETLD
jgi:hypothetical protein